MGASASTEAGPLHAAVAEGNLAEVRRLCSTASSSIINQEFNGETPLTLALRDSVDIAILRELLQSPRLDVNKPTTGRNTPLMTAVVLAGHPNSKTTILQKAELLAAHPKCRPGLRNAQNWTALEMAVRTKNPAIIGFLLRGERFRHYTVEIIVEVFVLAVKGGNVDVVGALLDSVPEVIQKVLLAMAKKVLNDDLESRVDNQPIEVQKDIPPLHAAISREDTAAVKEILQRPSTDVNYKVAGLTPLMLAACGRSPPIVQLLVDHPQIDVNMVSTGFKKMNALTMCVFAGGSADEEDRVKMVTSILAHPQCDPTLKDEDGVNALGMAAMFGNEKLADCLAAEGRIDRYALDDVWRCVVFAISTDNKDLAFKLCNAVKNDRKGVIATRLDRSQSGTDAVKAAILLKTHMVNAKLLNRTIKLAIRLGRPVVGSHVVIYKDQALVRMKQAEHNLTFAPEICGCWGIIEMITSNGDAEVKFYNVPVPSLRIVLCHPEIMRVVSRDNYEGRDADGQSIRPKDVVRVVADIDIARELQKSHGGLDDDHLASLGKLGEIVFFDEDGDVQATVGKQVSCYNPKMLRKVATVLCGDGSSVKVGDKVRIIHSAAAFQALQTDEFGDWSSGMADLIGLTLTVSRLHASNSNDPKIVLEMNNNGQRVLINPQAIGSCDNAHHDDSAMVTNTVTPAPQEAAAPRTNAEHSGLSSSDLQALQRNALELTLLQELDPNYLKPDLNAQD